MSTKIPTRVAPRDDGSTLVATLMKDARRVGTNVQERAEKIASDLERRVERIVGRVEDLARSVAA